MLAQLTVPSAVPKAMKVAHLLALLPKSKTIPGDVPHRNLLADTMTLASRKKPDMRIVSPH